MPNCNAFKEKKNSFVRGDQPKHTESWHTILYIKVYDRPKKVVLREIPCLSLSKYRLQTLRPRFLSFLRNYYHIQNTHPKLHQGILRMKRTKDMNIKDFKCITAQITFQWLKKCSSFLEALWCIFKICARQDARELSHPWWCYCSKSCCGGRTRETIGTNSGW